MVVVVQERHHTKQLLAAEELHNDVLFCSLRSALRPLMAVQSVVLNQTDAVVAANGVHMNNHKSDDNDNDDDS